MRSNSKLLTHVDTEMELNMIKGLFEDNDITILVEKQGTGAYLAVHSGFNYQGSDIYVSEDDFEEATNLLQVLEDIEPAKQDDISLDHESMSKDEENYKNKNRNVARIVILVPIVLFVLALLGTILNRFF